MGLTQSDLAHLLGVSNASLSAYERGVSSPDDRTIEGIARLAHQPVSEVRARWGLYNHGAPDEAPPTTSVLEAIVADPDLLPEAKEHLTRQYALLLRVQAQPESADHSRARDDLRRARAVRESSSDREDKPR